MESITILLCGSYHLPYNNIVFDVFFKAFQMQKENTYILNSKFVCFFKKAMTFFSSSVEKMLSYILNLVEKQPSLSSAS